MAGEKRRQDKLNNDWARTILKAQQSLDEKPDENVLYTNNTTVTTTSICFTYARRKRKPRTQTMMLPKPSIFNSVPKWLSNHSPLQAWIKQAISYLEDTDSVINYK